MKWNGVVLTVALPGMLLVAGWAAGVAFAADPPQIKQIRKIYYGVNKSLSGKAPDVTLCEDEEGKWVAIKKERNTDSDHRICGSVYRIGGKTKKIAMDYVTPSGDWILYIDYYFYDSGAVAFVFKKLVTFQAAMENEDAELEAPFVIETRHYFDEKGKKIRELLNIKDAKEKIVKKKDTISYMNPPIAIHTRIADFPFAKRLQAR